MDTESRMIDQESGENSKTLEHGIVNENVIVNSKDSVKFTEQGPSEKGFAREISEPSGSLGDRVVLDTVINISPERIKVEVQDFEKLDSRKNVVKEEGPCVIDVTCGKSRKSSENSDGEVVCRICHLSADQSPKASNAATKAVSTTTKDLIQLGCGCKGELGTAHRHCAEAWFKLKGNRFCEICGEAAKNITGVGDNRFMDAWNERRFTINGGSSERVRCWQGQPLCNFLMACLVIAFVLPWFFRVNMF